MDLRYVAKFLQKIDCGDEPDGFWREFWYLEYRNNLVALLSEDGFVLRINSSGHLRAEFSVRLTDRHIFRDRWTPGFSESAIFVDQRAANDIYDEVVGYLLGIAA